MAKKVFDQIAEGLNEALDQAADSGTEAPEAETGPEDGFEWEEALPSTGGTGGVSKYDWGSFPEPKDGRFPTKTYMGLKGPKPIYNSIKKFQAKLAADGKAYPEFTCRILRDGTGKDAPVVGVKVQRTK